MVAYWKYKHGEHIIEVKNNTASAELYVDGNVVDRQKGLISCQMTGQLVSGETITVSLSAGFVPKCSLSIDGVLQSPLDVDDVK